MSENQVMAIPPATLARMVSDSIAKGCAVEIGPDGRIKITPPAMAPADAFDAIDMRRK